MALLAAAAAPRPVAAALECELLAALTTVHACQAKVHGTVLLPSTCSRSRQNAPHRRPLQAMLDLNASR